MKTSVYSLIGCLLGFFVFTQCNSSPTQQNITQVVGQQWKDSIIIDMFSAYIDHLQQDTSITVTLTAKGQALFKPVNLIFDTLGNVYAPAKYQPSKFEIWIQNTMQMYPSAITDTNTIYVFRNKSDNSVGSYAVKPMVEGLQMYDLFYQSGFGFQLNPPLSSRAFGEIKIYYE